MHVKQIIERFPRVTFNDIKDTVKLVKDNKVNAIFNLVDKILNKPKEVADPIADMERLLDLEEPKDELLKTLSVFIKAFLVLAVFIIPIAFRDDFKGNPAMIYAAILSLPKAKKVLEKTIKMLSQVKGDGEKGAKDAIGLIAFSIVQAMSELSREVMYGRVKANDVVDLLELAKKAAEIYGDERLNMDVDYSRAVFFFSIKRYDEAAKIFENINSKTELLGEGRKRIIILVKLGLAQSYYYLGRYQDSIMILDSVINLFSKEDRNTELIFAFYFKGKNLMALGRRDEGLSLIKKAMEVAKGFDMVAYRLIKDELEKIEEER